MSSKNNLAVATGLIRLGSAKPELRPHIRYILASLTNPRVASDKSLALAIKTGKEAENLLSKALREATPVTRQELSKAHRRLMSAVGMLEYTRASEADFKKALSWVGMVESVLDNILDDVTLTEKASYYASAAYGRIGAFAGILHEDVLGLGRRRR